MADILIRFGVAPENTEECLNLLVQFLNLNGNSYDADTSSHRLLNEEAEFATFDNKTDFFYVFMTFVCVTGAALASGLTLGLMSSDVTDLQIKMYCGTETEKKQATRVLKLVSNHHLLLVTLLLFNSISFEALPLFLDRIVPSYLAIIISVTFILFFGEIFPAAIFTGPKQLQLGYLFSPFTRFLIAFFSPIAVPIALLLDKLLVHDTRLYTREELSAFVSVQFDIGQNFSGGGPLSEDEVAIVQGVLKTSVETVKHIMMPIEKVYSLNSETVLDQNGMIDIMRAGFSRIPVYEGADCGNIRGYIIVKTLIVVHPEDQRLVSSLHLKEPLVVDPDLPLLQLLNQFQEGTHLAVVSEDPAETRSCLKEGRPLTGVARVIGIITLEDIIEELLQEEIEDERDKRRSRVEQHYLDVIRACVNRKVQNMHARSKVRTRSRFSSSFSALKENFEMSHTAADNRSNRSGSNPKECELIVKETSYLTTSTDNKQIRYDGQFV